MSDSFVGQVSLFAFNFPPRGWELCGGQVMSISSHTSLFSLIGTNYGGDGRTTFQFPDLRGRVPTSFGQRTGGENWNIGESGGVESLALSGAHLPTHTHAATFKATSAGTSISTTLQATTEAGDSETPSAGAFLATAKPSGSSPADLPEHIYKTSPSADSLVNLGGIKTDSSGDSAGTVTISHTGGGLPLSMLQPTLALNYSIVVDGLYPSRN